MEKVILKSVGLNVSKKVSGQLLLTISFRKLDEEEPTTVEFNWMPQWDTIRDIIKGAVLIEAMNSQGGERQELDKFKRALEEATENEHFIFGLFRGQHGIESQGGKDR